MPFFKNPVEAIAWMQRNGMIQNQFEPNTNLDWATTNQMVNPQISNPQSVPNQGITITEEQLNNDTYTDPTFNDPELLARMEQNRQGNQASYNKEDGVTNNTNTNFQFFNPYGGYDLPSSTFKLGQSVQNKDTLGIVAGGAKVGLSLARNFLGGLAYNKQNQKVMDEYKENQRKTVTQENTPVMYEEGGEHQQGNQEEQLIQEVAGALQNGEDPQMILQTLIEIGIEEQTAQAMIEMVIQELQATQSQSTEEVPMMAEGGTYLEQMKGKTIKSYILNEKTGNYEVEFE